MTEDDTEYRNNWRSKIRCGGPWREMPKEDEEHIILLNHVYLAQSF